MSKGTRVWGRGRSPPISVVVDVGVILIISKKGNAQVVVMELRPE